MLRQCQAKGRCQLGEWGSDASVCTGRRRDAVLRALPRMRRESVIPPRGDMAGSLPEERLPGSGIEQFNSPSLWLPSSNTCCRRSHIEISTAGLCWTGFRQAGAMLPEFSADFYEKIWLSIFDKLALGTIGLVLGYYISRRLEGIKSREAVRKTMLERRVSTILTQWDAVRLLHWDTVAVSADRLVEETRTSDSVDTHPERDAECDGTGVTRGGKENDPSLIQRAWKLREEIRNSRNLLGKTIADGAIAAELNAAKTLESGKGLQSFPQDSPDFRWLEGLLDAPDVEELPLMSHERTLAKSRAAFLEQAEREAKGT